MRRSRLTRVSTDRGVARVGHGQGTSDPVARGSGDWRAVIPDAYVGPGRESTSKPYEPTYVVGWERTKDRMFVLGAIVGALGVVALFLGLFPVLGYRAWGWPALALLAGLYAVAGWVLYPAVRAEVRWARNR